jgi:hypothetical protein
MKCYLHLGDDTLDRAKEYHTIAIACSAYRRQAEALALHGQCLTAALHIAPSRDQLQEYPDYTLTLNERGILVRSRA